MENEEDLAKFRGKDDPILEKFVSALIRGRAAEITFNNGNTYCFGPPTKGNMVEINSQEICSNPITIHTFINSNYIAFCYEHRNILVNYFNHPNQRNKAKQGIDEKLFPEEHSLIEKFFDEEETVLREEDIIKEDQRDSKTISQEKVITPEKKTQKEEIMDEQDFIGSKFATVDDIQTYSCVNKSCDEQLTYLGLCDDCFRKADLDALDDME